MVRSSEDVLRHLPAELLLPESDPIRDLLVDALAGLLQSYEARSDHAVAQSDVTRAIAQYLSALADDRSAGRARGEGDEALRARALDSGCVTETMIARGVNAILSLYTSTECELNDAALDRWFIHDGTDGNGGPAQWHSFVGAGPNYPDRLFSDDAVNNGGYSRPNSAVGGARLYSDAIGRHLLLRVPDLGFQNRDAAFTMNGVSPTNDLLQGNEGGFFVGNSSNPAIAAFLNATEGDAEAVYRAIYNFMDGALGQSIRWTMISDLVAT